jgi:hypothetical protein
MTSNNDNNVLTVDRSRNSHDIEIMVRLMTYNVIVEDVPFRMVRMGKGRV